MAFMNVYRDLEKFSYNEPSIAKEMQRKWKQWQWIAVLIVYLFIVYIIKWSVLKSLIALATAGILYQFVFDGFYNLLRGFPFYRISTTTQSRIEKFLIKVLGTNPKIHIVFRILALIISISLLIILWRLV
jgi:hypothetical protein